MKAKGSFFTTACVCVCLICIVMLFASPCAAQANENTAEDALGGILSYSGGYTGDIQEYIDTHLCTEEADGQAWYAIALSQYGRFELSGYEYSLLDYLESADIGSSTSRLKYALCLSAVGSTDEYILRSLSQCTGKQGLMSWVFGLHLLNNGYTCDGMDIGVVHQRLLELECDGGGWSVSGGIADTDATAMVIQALAPYYSDGGDVRDAVDRGLSLLSGRLSADADYSSYGVPNAESTAQVIIALSALGIDSEVDERFTVGGRGLLDGLEKYRLESGGYCHAEGGAVSKMATEQCFMAYVSYIRMLGGKGSIYMLDGADPDRAERPVLSDGDTDMSEGCSESSSESGTESVSESNSGSVSGSVSGSNDSGKVVRVCISIVLICVGGALCAVFAVRRVKGAGSYIIIIALVCLLVALVWVIDIKTPESYYSQLESGGREDDRGAVMGHVTVEVRCDTVAGRSDGLPSDGEILGKAEIEIYEGDTAYSVLSRAAGQSRINVSYRGGGQSIYVYGISTLYEFDFGELSGWMYRVNGQTPNVGAAEYALSDGDCVQWLYTCDIGNDIGE